MKNIISILVALFALGFAAFAVFKTSSDDRGATVKAAETLALEQRLNSLEGKLTDCVKRLDDWKNAPATAAPAVSRISEGDIASAVAKYVSEHPVEMQHSVAADASATDKPKKKGGKTVDLAAQVAKLMDPQLNYNDRRAIFQQLAKAGLLDQALEELEKKTEESKGSADAQFLLGSAYIEKLQTVSDGPEKGVWAMKADAMFDKALEIDPNHWGSRFSKAISLAFWPPIFGKQNEAISQFETLRKQQEESGSSKPEFAQTYQFLGNLYQQQGKNDLAQQTWQKGSQLFPNDEGLKAKLVTK
ncbi:MAG: hypothetical protein HY286_14380 [Planctomycetes bacterium]|nr:hypothetical protein [Planctomycetota bacterium]